MRALYSFLLTCMLTLPISTAATASTEILTPIKNDVCSGQTYKIDINHITQQLLTSTEDKDRYITYDEAQLRVQLADCLNKHIDKILQDSKKYYEIDFHHRYYAYFHDLTFASQLSLAYLDRYLDTLKPGDIFKSKNIALIPSSYLSIPAHDIFEELRKNPEKTEMFSSLSGHINVTSETTLQLIDTAFLSMRAAPESIKAAQFKLLTELIFSHAYELTANGRNVYALDNILEKLGSAEAKTGILQSDIESIIKEVLEDLSENGIIIRNHKFKEGTLILNIVQEGLGHHFIYTYGGYAPFTSHSAIVIKSDHKGIPIYKKAEIKSSLEYSSVRDNLKNFINVETSRPLIDTTAKVSAQLDRQNVKFKMTPPESASLESGVHCSALSSLFYTPEFSHLLPQPRTNSDMYFSNMKRLNLDGLENVILPDDIYLATESQIKSPSIKGLDLTLINGSAHKTIKAANIAYNKSFATLLREKEIKKASLIDRIKTKLMLRFLKNNEETAEFSDAILPEGNGRYLIMMLFYNHSQFQDEVEMAAQQKRPPDNEYLDGLQKFFK